jgi:8-amino-7-oxononanoate synthase
LDQGGFVLELGDGDLLAIDPSRIEALRDDELDGPEIPKTLQGGIRALTEEIVVPLLDAAIDTYLRIKGRLGGDDQALGPLDLALRLQNIRVPFEGELQAIVERVAGRRLSGNGQSRRGARGQNEDRGKENRTKATDGSTTRPKTGKPTADRGGKKGSRRGKDSAIETRRCYKSPRERSSDVFLPSLKSSSKPLLERYASDVGTKLRHKYHPYYHSAEAQEGPYVVVEGRRMLMMSSNEYLGLSAHPKVRQASIDAIRQWGTSPCGSRLANGSRSYHGELEAELAAFLGVEACQVLSAGYLACMGSLSTLIRRGDAVLVDKSIHSALWDGALLSNASIERFSHEDMGELERLLASLPSQQAKAIAVDGVYSMEGHIASLPQLVEMAEKYRALLIVDDAHGFGVVGREGRGTADHFGMNHQVDVTTGSFSKSLASTGGFMAGSRAIIEYLRSNCRQIIFSAGLPASQAAAALTALRIMQAEPEHRQRLLENATYYRAGLAAMGVDFWNSPTPGLPIVIGDKEKCYRVWSMLWEQGFFTVMAISPGVAAGRDLIRTSVTALHTRPQIDSFLTALQGSLKKFGLIH